MTRVSVITPVFNGIQFLEETAASVLGQTFHGLEWIVVDDGSTDGSRELIMTLADRDERVRPVLLDRNMGPAGSRNAGIDRATGRYIAFLDCDDVWLPQKLEKQLAFMEATGAPLSFTAYRKMDEDGTLRGVVPAMDVVDYQTLLKSNVIGMLTAMYDRDKLGTRHLPDIRKRQDYALWLAICREGFVARGLNEPLAMYRVRAGSVSRNKWQAIRYQWRVYRELEGLSVPVSAWYFAHYAVRGFLKSRI